VEKEWRLTCKISSSLKSAHLNDTQESLNIKNYTYLSIPIARNFSPVTNPEKSKEFLVTNTLRASQSQCPMPAVHTNGITNGYSRFRGYDSNYEKGKFWQYGFPEWGQEKV
jgi:hypothetical protein